VRPERPRARRYPFVAAIELTDIESEKQMREKTTDLSVFGCYVQSSIPVAVGAKVRIRISHNGSNFVASGKIAYARENKGFGIAFSKIEPNDQRTLERWIAELRNRYAETPA
jgi:hypothetical protein